MTFHDLFCCVPNLDCFYQFQEIIHNGLDKDVNTVLYCADFNTDFTRENPMITTRQKQDDFYNPTLNVNNNDFIFVHFEDVIDEGNYFAKGHYISISNTTATGNKEEQLKNIKTNADTVCKAMTLSMTFVIFITTYTTTAYSQAYAHNLFNNIRMKKPQIGFFRLIPRLFLRYVGLYFRVAPNYSLEDAVSNNYKFHIKTGDRLQEVMLLNYPRQFEMLDMSTIARFRDVPTTAKKPQHILGQLDNKAMWRIEEMGLLILIASNQHKLMWGNYPTISYQYFLYILSRVLARFSFELLPIDVLIQGILLLTDIKNFKRTAKEMLQQIALKNHPAQIFQFFTMYLAIAHSKKSDDTIKKNIVVGNCPFEYGINPNKCPFKILSLPGFKQPYGTEEQQEFPGLKKPFFMKGLM